MVVIIVGTYTNNVEISITLGKGRQKFVRPFFVTTQIHCIVLNYLNV